ncbi:outer membrane protein assembly factor BamA [Treponema parvum]|uniref:outer membrane protein assembly factor BamA n=1 Tax=Treponema parvum TaxID=138851 RepID=UPI00211E39F5|nr:outer membrane protein assembly factor BamA [Treponema parvum]
MRSMRRPLLYIFFAAVLCSCLSVWAQENSGEQPDPDNWYLGKNITSITFEGLKNVRKVELDGIISSFINKPFNDELFGNLLDRLYAVDFFDDISPTAHRDPKKEDGVRLVFTVEEKPVVSRIVFSGNNKIRNGELRDAIALKTDDIFVLSKVLVDERAIRNKYLEKGYLDIKVTSKTTETDGGIIVTFYIEEGYNTVVTDIKFSGNRIISSKTLTGRLKMKKKGLFRKGAFEESQLETDKQEIVKYYKDSGYINASVIDVIREITKNEEKKCDELTLTFVIQEGAQYTFGGISFVGNTIFPLEQIESLVKLKKGDIFNQTKFQESVMAVADLYYENGYTSNKFDPAITQDADARVVSVVLNIEENARSHVENIIVRGNTKTKEEIILREIPIESGDVFSKAKVTTGLRNLYNLQYFSGVVPDVTPGSEENLVNLVVSVEEQSTTSIEFGLTFSGVTDPDDLPFALFLKWQDSNIRGTGKSISASTTLATDEQSVTVGFDENWLFGKPISFSEALTFSHASLNALRSVVMADGTVNTNDYYLSYEQWNISLNTGFGRRWTPDWAIIALSGGLTNRLINNVYDEDLYRPLDSAISNYANEWGLKNAVWAAFSLDDRDINWDPSKGWFFSQRFSWYGLTPFETEFYLQSATKGEFYFTLWNLPVTETWSWKMVLAGYSGLTMQVPAYNSFVSRTSQLYIDGMFTGRGWTNIYNSLRGRALWTSYLELRMPVVRGVLAVDGFLDAAVVKESPYELFNDFNINDFYFSTGPGLRFSIQQFPLRLLFASKFRHNDERGFYWDDIWRFVLSFNIINK